MTTIAWSTIRTEVRNDVLRDPNTAKFTDAQILRFANQAIRLSWPLLYVRVTDSSTTVASTVVTNVPDIEYSLPSGIPDPPGVCPLYRVEMGPIGGIKATDSSQTSMRYLTLRSKVASAPMWEVDWSRRKLKLYRTPWFDSSAAYNYKLRMHYVRPIAELVNDTDQLEGPTGFVPVLLEWCEYAAFRSQLRGAISNADRFANLGNVMKFSKESFHDLFHRHCQRMPWPKIMR